MVLFRKKKESCEADKIIQLQILEGNSETGDLSGKVFDLQCGNNFIGRDSLCEIVLNSSTVSRRHANLKVSYDKAKFLLFDLGSSNGIIIKPSTLIKNGKKQITSGDQIQIGEILLKLLAIDQEGSLATMTVDVDDILKEAKEKPEKKE
jgi:pSer/pThr/pTyr-binding forkhead associated (FHA) protein